MSGLPLSKERQLRGGSDQARRRAERASRAYRPGERNGPETTDALAEWEAATVEARTLNAEKSQQYGPVWAATCEAIADVLYDNGIINSRELTGRNALAVAKLACLYLGEH